MNYIVIPKFTGRNVPIAEIAKATVKDPQFIRLGLQRGIFKFGYALQEQQLIGVQLLLPRQAGVGGARLFQRGGCQ